MIVQRAQANKELSRSQDQTKQLMILGVEAGLVHSLATDSSFFDRIIDRFAHKSRQINLIIKKGFALCDNDFAFRQYFTSNTDAVAFRYFFFLLVPVC